VTHVHPFWATFVIFIALLFPASWCHWRFLRRARREFPSLWRDMGQPTGWTDGTLIGAFGTYWYLFRRSYRKRGDASAIQFCERFRLPMLVTYAAALISCGVFLLGLLVWGKP